MFSVGRVSVLVVVLLAPTVIAMAQDKDQDADKMSLFSQFGFTRVNSAPGKPCVVESTLSEDDFVKAIPTLQKVGILNPDITQTEINTKPHLLESAFTMEMAPLVTQDLFEKNDKVMTCQFRQILSDVDDYGTDRKRLIFSYKFDRATNNRVNWDNFKAMNFPKIAPAFKYEAWFLQSINEETE